MFDAQFCYECIGDESFGDETIYCCSPKPFTKGRMFIRCGIACPCGEEKVKAASTGLVNEVFGKAGEEPGVAEGIATHVTVCPEDCSEFSIWSDEAARIGAAGDVGVWRDEGRSVSVIVGCIFDHSAPNGCWGGEGYGA